MLIAIEGIDGAGKTTLANALVDTLQSFGQAAVYTKEPTHGQWGALLRASAHSARLTLEEECDYLERDRREHVVGLIDPKLLAGAHVVLDRYYYSMAAYQGAAGADPAMILARNMAFAPRPDITFLLDLPVEVGLERIRRRGDVPNAFETNATLEDCRAIFNSLQLPEIVRIDATASIERVHEIAMGHVLRARAEWALAKDGFTPAAAERLLAFGGG